MPYTAQFILQGASNLPEDRYVNTFAFAEDGGTPVSHEDAATGITSALETFYTTDPAALGTLEQFYPLHVGTVGEVRVYNFADDVPREPIINTFAFSPGASGAIPSEVAVCLSYYADRNLPTQRGRIFLGPLTRDTFASQGTAPARPSQGFIDLIAACGTRLAVTGAFGGLLRWSVLSRVIPGVGTFQPITDGWVDNAFDVQRRRGEDATARTTWTVGS